jgi:hypothetical protein
MTTEFPDQNLIQISAFIVFRFAALQLRRNAFVVTEKKVRALRPAPWNGKKNEPIA